MSSGLTRRRGGGTTNGDNDENNSSRVASPVPRGGSSRDQPETSYESGENGHKIAFDPRDMSESAERSKQPKLTMMEEVLLLGLKDKQVMDTTSLKPSRRALTYDLRTTGLFILLER